MSKFVRFSILEDTDQFYNVDHVSSVLRLGTRPHIYQSNSAEPDWFELDSESEARERFLEITKLIESA